jgi:hypothetical protein
MRLAEIYENYAVTDSREKDLEEAIRCMEECVKRDGSWSLWKRLGDLYFKKKVIGRRCSSAILRH